MPADATAPRRWLLPSLLAAVMSAWAPPAQAGAFADFGVQRPKHAVPAPDFTLPRLGGGRLSLSALHGRVVILHFWATWCLACRREMPQIEALQRREGRKVVVLGINVDRGNRAGVEHFVQAHGIGFPNVRDADGAVRRRYRIRALPTSYLIGTDGRIIGRIIGARNWGSPAARAMIGRLLKATAPTAAGKAP